MKIFKKILDWIIEIVMGIFAIMGTILVVIMCFQTGGWFVGVAIFLIILWLRIILEIVN